MRKVLRTLLGICAALLLAPVPLVAATLEPQLAEVLHAALPTERLKVIVQFVERPDLHRFEALGTGRGAHGDLVRSLKETASRSQRPLQALLRSQGFELRELWIRNALAVEVPAALVSSLAARPEVAEVLLDADVPAPEPVPLAAPFAPPTWNLQAIGAPAAWAEGYTGSGAIVAVLDTGVDVQHPDLAGSWKGNPGGWFNPLADKCLDNLLCTSCDANASTPCDFLDGDGIAHGTAVTSLITGRDASGSAIGVAPDARWIAAKIFGDGISSSTTDISAALQWALDPTGNPADVPDVVNNSWGFEQNPDQCLSQFFQPEIRALQAAGIHVVFAAGNTGPASSTSVSPANLPEGLAVGSVDSTLTVSSFSARGPGACTGSIYTDLATDVFPEIVAPGGGVRVATANSSWVTVGGTSFSAPHVSGALALLRGGINSDRLGIETTLLTTGNDLGTVGADNAYGRGIIDIPAAIQVLSIPPTPILFDPPDGAIDVDPATTFTWYQAPDPNGDPLTTTLLLATDSGFGDGQRIPVAMALLGGSLLYAAVLLLPLTRRRLLPALLIAVLASALLYSCGGSGGGGIPAVPLEPNRSFTLAATDTLLPKTTYFWKLEVSDPGGNIVESETRTFTTR